jgi:hypothetical protein
MGDVPHCIPAWQQSDMLLWRSALRNCVVARNCGRMLLMSVLTAILLLWAIGVSGVQQSPPGIAVSSPGSPWPNRKNNIGRPLRYRPEGNDFLIENGAECFNRPLYGSNTAFRVDAGDRPEFILYLPGRGGNLRLGLKSGNSTKWLHEAIQIISRYRPGEMIYDIRDPILGREGTLTVALLAMNTTDGLILRAEARHVSAGLELLWAYGGVNGQRGRRDGDIGTEDVPISEYFQLKPEFCRDNIFTLASGTFTLRAKAATIFGLAPANAQVAVADATNWASPAALLGSAGNAPELPVVVGHAAMTVRAPLFLALQRLSDTPVSTAELPTYRAVTSNRSGQNQNPVQAALRPAYSREDLPRLFAEAEKHFHALREQILVETPDPFLNAAAAALCIAADGVWDEPSGTVQHGAVAWRSRLLGWRGPFAMDALGWHDRARRHFTYWAGRQNTDPVPDQLPPADANANLARSEAALHSNGDMSNSHYDMNLVYIDALFRHLLWTGDLEFVRSVWPVIERHLAWERRLFRRPFGPAGLPLYEAYAAIWASDDLQYNGGGVAHASAYNYYHNRMAARLARLLGNDPAPYDKEAELIARAMRENLWLADRGCFAEYKDLLGLQLIHPSSALWTFYHTLDSGLATPPEAWQMTRCVERAIPRLPVLGPGVPNDQTYYVLSTTNWMPYTWSINNVVMGEVVHTALGYWQAGRAEAACRLMKSALLASMYMGICPGNVGSMNYLDVYRRESQRDFADPAGVLSRALVEGLFGVRPDALAGELAVQPGFPESWERACLRHPDVGFAFRRIGLTETYTIESRFEKPMSFRLQVAAFRDRVASVTVNGRPANWQLVEDSVAAPRIEIRGPAAARNDVVIAWAGRRPSNTMPGDRGGEFVKVQQGQMHWLQPADRKTKTSAPGAAAAIDWKVKLPRSTQWDTVDLAPYFNDCVTDIFRVGKYRMPRSPYVSLAIPSQGIGGWAGGVNAKAEINDTGLRAAAARNGGRIELPNGVPFATPGPGDAKNILFTSQWDDYPREANIPLSGRGKRLFLLMAGSTNWMQSRIDNGEVIVNYRDGTNQRIALHNPVNWWPIDQDYFIDDFAFSRPEPIPPRVDLMTGTVRILDVNEFKGKGRVVPGGAATVLDLPIDPAKTLKSLTIRALANEVVVGLMAATIVR